MTEEETVKAIVNACEKVIPNHQAINKNLVSFEEYYPRNNNRFILIGESDNKIKVFSGMILLNFYSFSMSRTFHNKDNFSRIEIYYSEQEKTNIPCMFPEELEQKIINGFQFMNNFLDIEGKPILDSIKNRIEKLNLTNKYEHVIHISKRLEGIHVSVWSYCECIEMPESIQKQSYFHILNLYGDEKERFLVLNKNKYEIFNDGQITQNSLNCYTLAM